MRANYFSSSARDQIKAAVVLLILLLAAFYFGLGERPLYKIQEVRIAETAREMMQTGNWLVPHFNGEVRLQKPPLPYWLTAASYQALGKIDEFSLRFAGAGFALATAFILFFWLARALDLRSAVVVVLCSTCSYLALRYFRSGEADAILLFFVGAACVLVYHIIYVAPTLHRVLLLHLCMGLGFLSKGPPGIVIPVLVLLVAGITEKQFGSLRRCLHPAGLALLLISGFGWYAAIFYTFPEQAGLFFGNQVDDTFIHGTHAGTLYWYVPHLFDYFAPWSLFIIPAAIWLYKTRPHPPAIRLALIWFGVTFIVLSLTVNKQTQYALLLNPALAVLIGYYLTACSGKFLLVNRVLFGLLFMGIIAGLGFQVAKHGAGNDDWLVFPALALVPAVAAFLLRSKQTIPYRELILASLLASGYIYSERYLFDASEKAQARQFMIAAGSYTPLFVYNEADGAVSFYAQRVIPAVREGDMAALAGAHKKLYVVAPDSTKNWTGNSRAIQIMERKELSLWEIQEQ